MQRGEAMIVLAIIGTIAAAIWSLLVFIANGMKDGGNDHFFGGFSVVAAWLGVAVLWLAWWFN